jgi:hypothetical protein
MQRMKRRRLDVLDEEGVVCSGSSWASSTTGSHTEQLKGRGSWELEIIYLFVQGRGWTRHEIGVRYLVIRNYHSRQCRLHLVIMCL